MWKVRNCRQYYVNVEAQDRLHAALQHCSSQPVLCVRCILIFLENKCKRQLHHSSETESLLRLLQPSFIIETYLWLSWSCTNWFSGWNQSFRGTWLQYMCQSLQCNDKRSGTHSSVTLYVLGVDIILLSRSWSRLVQMKAIQGLQHAALQCPSLACAFYLDIRNIYHQ